LNFSEEPLINLLGNRSKLRILIALWKSRDELTVYRICKSTGLKRSVVHHHIRELVNGGLVQRKRYGEISLFTLNSDSPYGRAFKEFLDKTLGRVEGVDGLDVES